MENTVPYHIGPMNSYSLEYVTTDTNNFNRKKTEYENCKTKQFTFDTQIYCIYTPSSSDTTTDSIKKLTNISGSGRILTYCFLSFFNEISTSANNFSETKHSEFREIPKAFQKVNWKEPIPIVASNLLSSLILTHPLPNANHRTSLAFTTLYLEESCPLFTVDAIMELYTDESEQYIYESKQILTVRRNTTKFRILKESGCDNIERKNGVKIPLSQFDLTVSNPYEFYAEKHTELSESFIRKLLLESKTTDCLEKKDDGQQVFASRLTPV